jgi:5'-3' exonuclease
MPIKSLHLLPKPYQMLFAQDSPLLKYYPEEFEMDPFGALFESEYIAKLPYVDEALLNEFYDKVKLEHLSEQE